MENWISSPDVFDVFDGFDVEQDEILIEYKTNVLTIARQCTLTCFVVVVCETLP